MSKRRPPPLFSQLQQREVIERAEEENNKRHAARRGYPRKLYDGHLHLWADRAILSRLDWQHTNEAAEAATKVLQNDHGAQRYLASSKHQLNGMPNARVELAGAAYVQIEIRHATGVWEHALDEVKWLCTEQSPHLPFLDAIVPWAPLPEGRDAMEAYVAELHAIVPPQHHQKLKGFRYLLQEYPPGESTFPMLQAGFIDALRWCGEKGYSCACTVDTSKFGVQALEDVVEAITRVNADQPLEKRTKLVIDHLAKPDYGSALIQNDRSNFLGAYERTISELAFMPNVYLKFSGYINYLPPQLVSDAFRQAINTSSRHPRGDPYIGCKKALKAFLLPLLEAFGDHRIFWGSDWPICKMPLVGPSSQTAHIKDDLLESDTPEEDQARVWMFAYRLALEVLVEIGVSDEALDRIFFANAREYYRIQEISHEVAAV